MKPCLAILLLTGSGFLGHAPAAQAGQLSPGLFPAAQAVKAAPAVFYKNVPVSVSERGLNRRSLPPARMNSKPAIRRTFENAV